MGCTAHLSRGTGEGQTLDVSGEVVDVLASIGVVDGDGHKAGVIVHQALVVELHNTKAH